MQASWTDAVKIALLQPSLFLALLLGLLLCWRGQNVPEATALDPSRVVEVLGRIDALPEARFGQCRMRIRPLKIQQGATRIVPPGDIQLVLVHRPVCPTRPGYGDLVKWIGFLRVPSGYSTPGVADRRLRLWSEGIFFESRLKSPRQLQWRGADPRRRIPAIAFRFLGGFDRFCRRNLAADQRQVILGMLLGRPPDWDSDQRRRSERLGIVHLFVVSGLHVSLLAFILDRLLGRWPLARFLLVPLGLWGYVFLCGARPSAVRAGIMTTLFFLLQRVGVGHRPWNSLGLAALLILLIQPQAVFNPGFRFSFLALAALLSVSPGWAVLKAIQEGSGDFLMKRAAPVTDQPLSRLRRRVRFALEERFRFTRSLAFALGLKAGFRLLRPVGGMALAGMAVQTALFPLMLQQSNLAVWTQWLSNLLVAPTAGVLVPLSLLLLLLHATPLGHLTALLIGASAGLLLQWMALVERLTVTEFLPHPHALEAFLYWTALLLGFHLLRGWRRGWVLILPVVLRTWLLWGPVGPAEGSFVITMIDVGQGEAIHIQYPDGSQVLIDSGGQGPPGDADGLARRVTARYLWQQRITRLDAIWLTHPHRDHSGGFPFLRRRFRPRRTYVYGSDFAGLEQAERLPGMPLASRGEVAQRLLHPLSESGFWRRDANDRSLVLELRWRAFSVLLTGDAGEQAEKVFGPHLAPVTLLKVAHHGSRSATTQALLKQTRPQVAWISAGARNPFGHPSPQTLARLRGWSVRSFDTAHFGTLRLETDGGRYRVLGFHDGAFRTLIDWTELRQ